MGSLSFWAGDGEDPVMAEYDVISTTYHRQTAFIVCRLADVVKRGMEEAVGDEILGDPGYFVFEKHPACVVYRVTAQFPGADVLVLTFGDLRNEGFENVLRRAKSRDP